VLRSGDSVSGDRRRKWKLKVETRHRLHHETGLDLLVKPTLVLGGACVIG
jgi:hypothetical protein